MASRRGKINRDSCGLRFLKAAVTEALQSVKLGTGQIQPAV
jgi:hypothetical protein